MIRQRRIFVAALFSSLFLLGPRAAAEDRPPMLEWSANGMTEPKVAQGTPVVLQLLAIAPEKAMKLHVEGTVQFVVRAEDGSEVEWPWKAVPLAAPMAELQPLDSASVVWLLSPEATAELPPGTWRVRAAIDTSARADESEWRGKAESRELVLRIVAPPAEETVEEIVRRKLLHSEYEELSGNLEGALAQAEEILAAHPESVPGLLRKGDVLVEQEKLEQALDIYREAEKIFTAKDEVRSHPPLLIRRRIADTQARLFQLQ